MRRRSALLLASLLLLRPLAGAATTDLRIQLNPALASLHARDPARARAILGALEAILEGRPPAEPPRTRSIENPRERALIEANPLLQEAYRIDPKAALEQLREIVAAGGGG